MVIGLRSIFRFKVNSLNRDFESRCLFQLHCLQFSDYKLILYILIWIHITATRWSCVTRSTIICLPMRMITTTTRLMISHLWMKEDFWAKESFIPNIYNKFVSVDCIDSSVLFDPLTWVYIILGKFFHYVRTNITVLLLWEKTMKNKEKRVILKWSSCPWLSSNTEKNCKKH